VAKNIIFSGHALLKMQILREHGFRVDEEFIRNVVKDPDKIEKGHKAARLVAQKGIDKDHVIRVVYEERTDHLLIITMYPGRRKRYEKN